MKIIELLAPNCILPNLQATNKKGVLEELAKSLAPGPDELSLQTVMEVLLDRERLGSTGIGDNIAIPHGKLAQLSRLMLCFGRSIKGVDFDSMDGKPSQYLFHAAGAGKLRRTPSQGPGQDFPDAHEPAFPGQPDEGGGGRGDLPLDCRTRRGILKLGPEMLIWLTQATTQVS